MNKIKQNNVPLLSVRSLKKIYMMGPEDVEVLTDINLDVRTGTTVLVLGESGSGKSTLLNMIGGLDAPTRGSVLVNGLDIVDLREHQLTGYRNRMVGFIFQFHYLLKDFTALENVMMPSIIAGRQLKQARSEALALLDEVGLEHRTEHYPSELSGGERQRTAVARSLINSPALILADEPTGNLDEKNSDLVLSLLFDLVKKFSKTMIMVSHDRDIMRYADFSFLLEHGVLEKQ